jgi:predicted transcriptional regulator
MVKPPTSFRLSDKTQKRLEKIAKKDETSKAAVLERLIREESDKLGIK